jgi:hypothetical protein
LQAQEILANNYRYLNTPSVVAVQHPGVAWPASQPYGAYEDAADYRPQRSAASCSPQRARARSISHHSLHEYDDLMAEASKYRRRPWSSKPVALHAPATATAMGLTALNHRSGARDVPASNPTSHAASPVSAAGYLAHHAQPDAYHHPPTSMGDFLNMERDTAAAYHRQLRQLYCDSQRQEAALLREQQETEKLRQIVTERDAAVQDARSVARTNKQQLVRSTAHCLPRRRLQRSLALSLVSESDVCCASAGWQAGGAPP